MSNLLVLVYSMLLWATPVQAKSKSTTIRPCAIEWLESALDQEKEGHVHVAKNMTPEGQADLWANGVEGFALAIVQPGVTIRGYKWAGVCQGEDGLPRHMFVQLYKLTGA